MNLPSFDAPDGPMDALGADQPLPSALQSHLFQLMGQLQTMFDVHERHEFNYEHRLEYIQADMLDAIEAIMNFYQRTTDHSRKFGVRRLHHGLLLLTTPVDEEELGESISMYLQNSAFTKDLRAKLFWEDMNLVEDANQNVGITDPNNDRMHHLHGWHSLSRQPTQYLLRRGIVLLDNIPHAGPWHNHDSFSLTDPNPPHDHVCSAPSSGKEAE